jgi:2-amino-4-hydroxy-6-hydroxymethyldihydropteridine diphosphokinase
LSQIFIALGSNLGNRTSNLKRAIADLPPVIQVLTQSPIYETEPWGYTEQPRFLNQIVEGETQLSPYDLLKYIKKAEVRLGRKPEFRYGPRIIDIDILFYDHLIFEYPGLKIPHPRLHERAFVLVPLADIAPDFIHPVYQLTIAVLLARVDKTGVNLFKDDSP